MNKTKLSEFCSKFIEWGIIITLSLTPLIFSTKVFNVFTLPKLAFFRALVFLMLVAWIIKIIEEKKKDFYKIKFAIPIAVFLFIYILSVILGIDPYRSFWGLDMQMDGFYSFIFYILFFFLAATHIKNLNQLKRMATFIIYSSLLVSLYAIMQHFNSDFITNWSTNVQKRAISTIGNPLHLGRYLLMVMPLTLAWIFFQRKMKEKYIFIFILAMQVLAVLFTLSRSVWLTALVTFFVFFFLLALQNKKKAIWLGLIAFVVLLAVSLSFIFTNKDADFVQNNVYLNRFVSTFSKNNISAVNRLIVFQTAFEGIKEKPIIGHGPAVFFYVFNKNYQPELMKYDLQDYQSSHNQFLDLAVAHGILGFIAFASLVFYFFYAGLKIFFKAEHKLIKWLALASVCGVLAFLMENLFVFSNPTSYVYFYFFLALVSSFYNSFYKEEKKEEEEAKYLSDDSIRNPNFLYFYLLLLIAVLILIFWTLFLPLLANHYYNKTLSSNDLRKKYNFLQSAMDTSGAHIHPDYYGFLAETNLNLASTYYQKGNQKFAVRHLEKAAELSKELREIVPLHLHIYLLEGQIYNYWGSKIDSQKLELSDETYKKAVELAPNKLSTYWFWGDSLLDRDAKEKAIEKYKQAIEIDPRIWRSYKKIFELYKEMGRKEEAKEAREKFQELKSNR